MCGLVDFGGPAMVDCDELHTLPTVALSISGREFTLTPKQYVLKVDAGVMAGGGWIGLGVVVVWG
jgi:hypothetical protein